MQDLLEDEASDLPSKGDAAISFRSRYYILVDGLKSAKSDRLFIKEYVCLQRRDLLQQSERVLPGESVYGPMISTCF